MLFYSWWKRACVLAVLLGGALVASGNLFSQEQRDALPSVFDALLHRVVLGLDLEGGIHILLQIEREAIWQQRLEDSLLALRKELRDNKIPLSAPPKLTRSASRQGSEQSILLSLKAKQAETEETEDGEEAQKTPQAVLRTFARQWGFDTDKTSEQEWRLSLSDATKQELLSSALQHTIEILRRRIDESGTREPLIQRQGAARVLVEIPGVRDPEEVKALLGKTAKLTFHLLDERATGEGNTAGRVSADSVRLPSYERDPDGNPESYYIVRRRAYVSGEHLLDAQTVFEDNRPVVSFRFDARGARRFGRVTRENVGRVLAVVLDESVVSAPRIQSAILGGSGIITGDFSVEEANELALLLRAGALPAPLEILEERSVGPGLGRDSVRSGKRAALIGFLLVLCFMIVRYRLFGLFAATALSANLVLILAVLSLMGATLTLPGIAGIVLTTGMAVDANVLVFERIREESRAGGSVLANIEAGYKRAIATIVDSNITTLIAALILFAFGSGPIRGFAVTLSVGIATSLFTAVMLTRMLVGWWFRSSRAPRLTI